MKPLAGLMEADFGCQLRGCYYEGQELFWWMKPHQEKFFGKIWRNDLVQEIIVLGKKGSILQRGSHDELLALKGGKYWEYWQNHLGNCSEVFMPSDECNGFSPDPTSRLTILWLNELRDSQSLTYPGNGTEGPDNYDIFSLICLLLFDLTLLFRPRRKNFDKELGVLQQPSRLRSGCSIPSFWFSSHGKVVEWAGSPIRTLYPTCLIFTASIGLQNGGASFLQP
ncbi:hypothetical protein CCUS01_11206 [Colletotrichum cuscutae]|uniref:Uncharacterized protein n=1 Tax=Colletotrichum cuscutae TaxID=1209917 RepID=A0AAI9XJ97_9PEZI|nr:hypothetical protein CCUS01_11206 [Colletotrichum cuscutae]